MSLSDDHREHPAAALVRAMTAMADSGLNRGSTGNFSVRIASGYLITPSGIPVSKLEADMMVPMTLTDDDQDAPPPWRPSSEWRFHRDIYRTRCDVHAIAHAHSPAATALSCRRQGLPPFHYMVAMAGGRDVRCAPYATFGTQALSDAAITALRDRRACLLANHGMIATGTDIDAALALAVELESLAQQYLLATAGGDITLLDDDEMDRVIEKFRTYGANHGDS